MKFEILDVFEKITVYDIDEYEVNEGVLTLYLSNGSIIQYGPYDWYSCGKVEG